MGQQEDRCLSLSLLRNTNTANTPLIQYCWGMLIFPAWILKLICNAKGSGLCTFFSKNFSVTRVKQMLTCRSHLPPLLYYLSLTSTRFLSRWENKTHRSNPAQQISKFRAKCFLLLLLFLNQLYAHSMQKCSISPFICMSLHLGGFHKT